MALKHQATLSPFSQKFVIKLPYKITEMPCHSSVIVLINQSRRLGNLIKLVSKSVTSLKEIEKWGWRAGLVLKSTCCSSRSRVQFLAPIQWLSTICNSSSGGCNALSWSLQAPGTHLVHFDVCRQNIHKHRIKCF